MTVSEAIILAGGFGTRLRSVISDGPKVMAPVNGKPFLHYQMERLIAGGVRRIVVSVGYLKESIINWCDGRYPGIDIDFAIEETPLGTGGGIVNALRKCHTTQVLVLNGDSFFEVNLQHLADAFFDKLAECLLGLKVMHQVDRFGTVEMDDNGRITCFREKRFCEEALINAGVYILDKNRFLARKWPDAFSFEKA